MQLTTGQIVHWPPAPLGWAQVIELRRTKVRLFYVSRRGTDKFPEVNVRYLAAIQDGNGPLLPLFNPLRRACMGRSKRFPVAQTQETP